MNLIKTVSGLGRFLRLSIGAGEDHIFGRIGVLVDQDAHVGRVG
jgi:hypothetical protein